MLPRNNIKITQGALVCEESKLRGEITIGTGTIVHPSSVINAEAGPIIIGEGCLIEEQARIHHRASFDTSAQEGPPQTMSIGSNNVFEIDCKVEAVKIGNNNIFESKCFVGNKVTIMDGCIIGAGCVLTEEQIIGRNTMVFGESCTMREMLDKPLVQVGLMDTLSKLLPNYHHMRKPNKKV